MIMSENLGPYGTTEEFFKRREHLLKNKPKCPTCNSNENVNIYIQISPINWICSSDNTRWNQEV